MDALDPFKGGDDFFVVGDNDNGGLVLLGHPAQDTNDSIVYCQGCGGLHPCRYGPGHEKGH